MNFLKTILVGAIALSTVALASAQQLIYIVGSNGDRQATQTAIANLLTAGGTTWQFRGNSGNADRGVTASGVTTGLSNAQGSNYGAWNGTYSSTNVIIRTSFIGAAGSVAALAANLDARFAVSNGTSSSVIDLYSAGANVNTDYTLNKANFGFSTNFQATTPYNGVYNGVTYASLITETVGISPLVFLASPGFPAGKNLTTAIAKQLYKSGVISLALFTGDVNDTNKLVYALGRNTDAGQRYGTYAEFGLGALSSVTVWQPSISGATTTNGITTGGTANSHILWPAETVSGVSSPTGSGGYVTGANLAPSLTVTLAPNAYKTYDSSDPDAAGFVYPDATAGYYLGYLTPADATNRVTAINADGTTNATAAANIPVGNRGIQLKFNGVDFNTTNVQNGTYTAWLYNRILKKTATLTPAIVNTFHDALRDEIKNNTATQGGGLKDDTNFRVRRNADGGNVLLK